MQQASPILLHHYYVNSGLAGVRGEREYRSLGTTLYSVVLRSILEVAI
jgi:hypothetical protein